MTKSEKAEILEEMSTGRAVLADVLAGIDEAQAVGLPQSGGWSILGCVEHIAVTERYLLSRLAAGSLADRSHENKAIEATIRARALDRTRLIEAPEPSRPNGRFVSLEEAFSRFDATRAESIRWVEGFGHDLRWWLTEHPMTKRPVNGYEMLLMMARHPVRHARQIEEIRKNIESAEVPG